VLGIEPETPDIKASLSFSYIAHNAHRQPSWTIFNFSWKNRHHCSIIFCYSFTKLKRMQASVLDVCPSKDLNLLHGYAWVNTHSRTVVVRFLTNWASQKTNYSLILWLSVLQLRIWYMERLIWYSALITVINSGEYVSSLICCLFVCFLSIIQ